jgi:drug/metabolite transporter (DMT)-like permease
VASAPLVSVAIAALALREPLTIPKVAGSVIAIAGVAAVCLSRSGASVTSAIWVVVGAAVVQGIYHPLIRPLLRIRTGLEVATYAMAVGAVLTLPLLPWGWEPLATAPASAWGAAVYLALVPSAIGFVLWGYVVANLSMASATCLLYLVPAAAVLIAFIWLGEAPQPSELLGGLIILAGVGLIGQGDRLRAHLQAGRAPAGVGRRPTGTTEPDSAPVPAIAQPVASRGRTGRSAAPVPRPHPASPPNGDGRAFPGESHA